MIKNDKRIVLVSGLLCSGKGTFCSRFTQQYPFTHVIYTSDVVRQVAKLPTDDRAQLQQTKSFDMQIADELIRVAEIYGKTHRVLIEGIRQVTIVNRILDRFGSKNVSMVWLTAPLETLKDRYYYRNDSRDQQQSFEQALQNDADLGLPQVEVLFREHGEVINF